MNGPHRSRTASTPRPRPPTAGSNHRRRRGARQPTPASLDGRTVRRIPRRHREDAIQQAWLATLRKKNPNTAASAYVNSVRRREARIQCFSQIQSREWDKVREKYEN